MDHRKAIPCARYKPVHGIVRRGLQGTELGGTRFVAQRGFPVLDDIRSILLGFPLRIDIA
jgi:hypothetical protein